MPAPGRQVSAAGAAARTHSMGRGAPAAVVARVGVERAVPMLRRRNSLADLISFLAAPRIRGRYVGAFGGDYSISEKVDGKTSMFSGGMLQKTTTALY